MKHLLLSIIASLPCVLFAQGSPTFSVEHGYFSDAFKLSITPSVAGAEVRYTLDCSTPTLQSPVYKSPISIKGTTVVRAAELVTPDSLSFTTTASYIFPRQVLNQACDAQGNPIAPEGYPAQWGPFADMQGTAPGYYAMDSHIVAESSTQILEGLDQLPVVSVVTDRDNFFGKSTDPEKGGIYIYTGAPVGNGLGRDWERRISLELIGGPLSLDYTADCATKIHGGHSRLPEKNPKHALRLMFKGKYGTKKLKYPIFGTEEPMVSKFEDLVLRTFFGNAWTHWAEDNRVRAQYTRDLWARAIQERLGMPASHGQPVHLFINGMYWGIYNLCERLNGDHFAQHYGGEKADYDVIKVEETEGEAVEASDGTLDEWKHLVSLCNMMTIFDKKIYYRLQGLDANGEPSDTYEPMLDMDNFIDYMLINFYAGNTDWDHHNWIAFRNRVEPDCGFRFICWDSELIFGNVNEDVTTKINNGKPTGMLRALMVNSEFKRRFNHRAHLMFTDGGQLTSANAVAVFDSLYQQIDKAIYAESARWGDYRRDIHKYTSAGHRYRVDTYYQNERTRLLTEYFPKRTSIVISQLKNLGWYKDKDDYVSLPAISASSSSDSDDLTPIYDIHGVRVSHLQSGQIYIRGGRKFVAN